MKWVTRAAIVLGGLLALIVALPFFISLTEYIPQIEKEASAKLKEPVTIKSIRLAPLPLPHLAIDGVTVGKSEDLKLGKVTVTPDLFSLLGTAKVIRSIEIDSLVLNRQALDRILALSRSDPAKQPPQPPAFRVENIRLDNALVKLDKTNFGPFDARVRLNVKGDPEDASITTRDGKLKASIRPDKSNYLIEASAQSWKMPVEPVITFDELVIKGVATANDASFSQVSAKLYGGTVSGKAAINWQKGFRVKANLVVDQVDLKPVAALLSAGTRVSGRLNARPVFSASAADAARLMNSLHVEAPFQVHNGVLHGVDIQSAATSLFKQGSKGGETRFDQLSGHLQMDRGAYRFTQLKIASGVLAADGTVSISPKKELSGRVNAQVQALGANAAVPLMVAGTVDMPVLLPSGASVAGAAVGTAILGPGLGTTLGAKVGGWAQDLFSKDDKQSRK